ncbi:hypothetical protein DAETH_46480 (plasmid) [Deinococcus aetherius]|uniref:Uncharacterized protein n=1 Tax=Deinococcus aetherius TaxID=200252 RepID=A0ABM8ALQ4_9DEIO|nr:hypothetical protein DAETH_46480 [Deinococcus aetherius]
MVTYTSESAVMTEDSQRVVRVREQAAPGATLKSSVIVGGVTQTGRRTRGQASMPDQRER